MGKDELDAEVDGEIMSCSASRTRCEVDFVVRAAGAMRACHY